jgi:hypothetical protein
MTRPPGGYNTNAAIERDGIFVLTEREQLIWHNAWLRGALHALFAVERAIQGGGEIETILSDVLDECVGRVLAERTSRLPEV